MKKLVPKKALILAALLTSTCLLCCCNKKAPDEMESTNNDITSGLDTSEVTSEIDSSMDIIEDTVPDSTSAEEQDDETDSDVTIAPPVVSEPEGTTAPPTPSTDTTSKPVTTAPTTTAKPETTAPVTTAPPKKFEIDFPSLKHMNPDIYAWLDIPGTKISEAILQNPYDDTYYHRRDIRKRYSIDGSLYTEATYNTTSFNDPVTIIYGHNMNSGAMFGNLQIQYDTQAQFNAHRKIVIYMPDKELHYTVFAAVPYNSYHILYNYDFTNQRTFRLFFKDILSIRGFESMVDTSTSLSSDDKVIILSTCLESNDRNRFLVCAKLTDTVYN